MDTSYSVERLEAVCKVSISGALTANMIPELKKALKLELEQETQEVVFDLGETTMLDSSGIGLLIATSNTLGQRSGHVKVVHPGREIFDLLNNMRLVTRLNVSRDPGKR